MVAVNMPGLSRKGKNDPEVIQKSAVWPLPLWAQRARLYPPQFHIVGPPLQFWGLGRPAPMGESPWPSMLVDRRQTIASE